MNYKFEAAYAELMDQLKKGPKSPHAIYYDHCIDNYTVEDEELLVSEIDKLISALWVKPSMMFTNKLQKAFSIYADCTPLPLLPEQLRRNPDVVRSCLLLAHFLDNKMIFSSITMEMALREFVDNLADKDSCDVNMSLLNTVGYGLLRDKWETIITLYDFNEKDIAQFIMSLHSVPAEVLSVIEEHTVKKHNQVPDIPSDF